MNDSIEKVVERVGEALYPNWKIVTDAGKSEYREKIRNAILSEGGLTALSANDLTTFYSPQM